MAKNKDVNPEQSEGGRRGGQNRWAKVSRTARRRAIQAVARARWGPPKKKQKNRAASKLAKLRWDRLSLEERQQVMAKLPKRKGKKRS